MFITSKIKLTSHSLITVQSTAKNTAYIFVLNSPADSLRTTLDSLSVAT